MKHGILSGVLLFGIRLLLNNSLSREILLSGLILSIFLALLSSKFFPVFTLILSLIILAVALAAVRFKSLPSAIIAKGHTTAKRIDHILRGEQ